MTALQALLKAFLLVRLLKVQARFEDVIAGAHQSLLCLRRSQYLAMRCW